MCLAPRQRGYFVHAPFHHRDSHFSSRSTLYTRRAAHGCGAFTLLSIVPTPVISDNTRNPAQPVSAHRSAASRYGQLPLSFIANAGQIDPTVRFQVRSGSGTFSFEPDGVALSLPALTPSVGIALHFDGANPNTTVDGTHQLPGIANFVIGNDPAHWHTNVPTYAGLVYHNLYPGVDLEYAGRLGLLKGTYTLAAGVDPAIIRWHYIGTDGVSLDPASGDLTINAPAGVTLTEQKPIAWQTRAGTQSPVTVGYRLNADESLQFAPGSYDPTQPLTIDPGLVYSTYLFGTSHGIAVDASGNAYLTGDFEATVGLGGNTAVRGGTSQATGSVSSGIFATELDAAGNALYWTYMAGNANSSNDRAYGIAVDGSGNAYLTGTTASTTFPTTPGAFQTTLVGNGNAFVLKLNATGGVVYSTYLGGSGGTLDDAGDGIVVSSSGNAYVTGYTSSANFPTTSGAAQTASGGGYDAFVSELNAAGTALVYSTYLGGSGTDQAAGIAVDGSGNAYVTGYTDSADFPTTTGAYATTLGCTGCSSSFVSKFALGTTPPPSTNTPTPMATLTPSPTLTPPIPSPRRPQRPAPPAVQRKPPRRRHFSRRGYQCLWLRQQRHLRVFAQRRPEHRRQPARHR
ncbi:MAG: DUF7948 domain-containing protein [Aggregatilineales bacterium]